MTKASRDTQGGRKERERRKERKREGEKGRGEKKEKRQVFPATNKRPGTHQRKRGVILSVAFRKTPGSKERKGEGKGEKGAKVPTGSNEPQKYFDRCGHLVPCRSGWLLRPLRSRKGMSQLGIPKMRQNHRTYGLGHLRSLRAALYPGRGYVGHTPVRRVHGRHSAGSSRVGTRPNTLRIGCAELKAVPHAGLGYQFLRVQVKEPEKEVEVHQVQRGHQL